jgi:hypothetical protein
MPIESRQKTGNLIVGSCSAPGQRPRNRDPATLSAAFRSGHFGRFNESHLGIGDTVPQFFDLGIFR